MRRAAVLVIAVIGCSKKATPVVPDALHGEWVIWCATTDASATQCLAKERVEIHQTFHPGGRVTASAPNGISMEGTWKLTGDELELSYRGGGMKLDERWRVRSVEDRLVLWDARNERGSILGRPDAKFEAAESPTTDGDAQAITLKGVRFTIMLPSGYRKTRDVTARQAWGPSSGEGFEVHLSASTRPQQQVDGAWVTAPCNDHDYGGETGSREHDRDVSIGTSFCIDPGGIALMCSVEHTRGHLEKNELKPALALCESIKVER